MIKDPEEFYFYLNISINLFSSLILLSTWLTMQKRDNYQLNTKPEEHDHGFLWLACAMFVWVILYIWQLKHPIVNNVVKHGLLTSNPSVVNAGIHILSTFNNFCFLLAFQYFDHLPKKLQSIQQYKRFSFVAIAITAFTTFLIIFLFWLKSKENTAHVSKFSKMIDWPVLPDTIISDITVNCSIGHNYSKDSTATSQVKPCIANF